MGFLVEIFLDVVVEGFMQMITWGWMRLLQMLLPWERLSDRRKRGLELGIDIVGLFLFVALVAGFIMLFQYGDLTKMVGRWVAFMSLGISLIPFVLMGLVKLYRFLNCRRSAA